MTFVRIFLFASLLFGTVSAFADEERNYTYWDVHPWHVGGNALFIGKASVTDTPYGGDLTFNKASVSTHLLVPINEKNFFIPRFEWVTFAMDWSNNPKFKANRFNYVQFALTFFTTDLDDWRWISRVDYNMDTSHFTDARYGLLSGLLWGSYNIRPDWHYHVGFYGYTGMKGMQIYPVIGFDYTLNKKWLFLLIFPIDYKIQYKFDDHWSLSLIGRPLKERFRTGSNEPQPSSIFSYSSIGTELNLRYEIFLRLEAEIFGGCNFGGSFYIKNRSAKKSLYTDVGIAPYGGAMLNYGF